jgi:hypothetical protein
MTGMTNAESEHPLNSENSGQGRRDAHANADRRRPQQGPCPDARARAGTECGLTHVCDEAVTIRVEPTVRRTVTQAGTLKGFAGKVL